MTAAAAARPWVLLVEDDRRVGEAVRDMLEQADFDVDGPYGSLSDGIAAVARHMPDFALLDIRLHGSNVEMLADDLQQYGIGFAFYSGTDASGMARRFPNAGLLRKPVDSRSLERAVRDGLAGTTRH